MLDEVKGSVEKSMSVWQQRGLNSYNWDNLAVEPTRGDEDVKLFRKIVGYEMTNPEKISDDGIARSRVREAFREGSKALYRTPEVWEEWARWETEKDRKNDVYEQSKHALPNCGLLVVSWAEGLEGSGDWDKAKKVYEDFIERCPCSLGFVMLERLVVRNMPDDMSAAREIFKRARRVLRQAEEVRRSEERSGDPVTEAVVGNGKYTRDYLHTRRNPSSTTATTFIPYPESLNFFPLYRFAHRRTSSRGVTPWLRS